jgi:DNA-binding CsgD family transcriptional regulator
MRVSSPTLVGRVEELEGLDAALDRVEAGEFCTALIGGEAGVGKSRLVGELESRARQRGMRVLAGDCVELAEGELPFAPVTGALRPLARELAPGVLEALPGREELARLLPELGGSAEDWISRDSALDESMAQSRLFEVLLALLHRLGEEEPVLLVIEDLHWADRSTRDFLSFLIRNARDTRMLLACTYRSDELHRRHPLRPFLAELDRRPGIGRFELAPLNREELAGMLGGILEREPDAALVADLFDRSDGNPFFAEELFAASSDGRQIPETLRDALMLRVESLSESTRTALRAAAAAGRHVTQPLLASVSDLDEAELDGALREAVEANILVQEHDAFAFRHALVREAVVGDTLPGERTHLHVCLAETLTRDPALAGAGGAAAEIAFHWWEARRPPEALSAALAAAHAAEEVFAFAEAHRHLENVLELWEQVEDAEERAGSDLAGVLARTAENAYVILETQRAAALAREAIELVDADAEPVQAALLHERLGRYLWVSNQADASIAAYHTAVDLMPPEPPTPELAKVLAAHGQILMLRGRPLESRERCEQAIEVARGIGDRASEGHALNTLGVDISSLGDRARGIECLLEAKRIAEEIGWVDEIGRAHVNLTEEVDWDGRIEEAIDMALEGAEAMRRLGARSYVVFLEVEVAQRLIRMGRLREASEALDRVHDLGTAALSDAVCSYCDAWVAVLLGDYETAEVASRRARQSMGQTRDSMYFGPVAAVEVELRLASGELEEAVLSFDRALDSLTGGEYPYSVSRLYSRGVRAYVAVAERARDLGDEQELARIEEAVRSVVERFDAVLAPEQYPEGTPMPVALAHRSAIEAELSRLTGASDAALWDAAVELWLEVGERLEAAYARYRQAEAMLAAGQAKPEIAEVLSEAASIARESGATVLLGEVESLGRRARLGLEGEDAEAQADGAAEQPFGLTDREREVLALLVEGRTNREIGAALFISDKTASVHVSRILAKLDVRGRVEAATKAQRLGITT